MKNMELYVHLPFCRRKCVYCDFPSYAGCEEKISSYITALLEEAQLRDEALGHPEYTTVFIGGGTPSIVPAVEMHRLLTGLQSICHILPGSEFTSEVNPGTLTPEWLQAAVKGGVNRLSMGLQAAQPRLLKLLGRIHTMEQVEASVAMARSAGIANINLDLMFGLPQQTLSDWQDTLTRALALQPQHLSCYGLIPEEGTLLNDRLESGEWTLPDEETERAMYDLALSMLAEKGFRQYEISNFALPGYECRHNLGYWQQVPYLGLGSSAASCLPGITGADAYIRTSNPPKIDDYLHGMPLEQEAISHHEAMFETMMLGLRTTAGVSCAAFEAMHGISLDSIYGDRLRAQAAAGAVRLENGFWRLTRRGMDIQNSVLVALMDD